MKTAIKESRSIAWGYAIIGFLWLGLLIFLMALTIVECGITEPKNILESLKAGTWVLTYLLAMSSGNFLMAIAVWRIFSFSGKGRHIVLIFAVLFSIAAVILLISTIASWFIKNMPEWYRPYHNVLPAAILAFQYSYLALLIYRLIRNTNIGSKTDAE